MACRIASVLVLALTVFTAVHDARASLLDMAALCSSLATTNTTDFLKGKSLRIALYSGELANCDANHEFGAACAVDALFAGNTDTAAESPWGGFDVELLNALANEGGFTYTIVSMGEAQSISTREGGYTGEATRMVEENDVDLMGNPTWRVTASRTEDFVWTAGSVSEDALFVTSLRTYSKYPKNSVLTAGSFTARYTMVFWIFNWETWVTFTSIVILYSLLMLCIMRPPDDDEDDHRVVTRHSSATFAQEPVRSSSTTSHHHHHHQRPPSRHKSRRAEIFGHATINRVDRRQSISESRELGDDIKGTILDTEPLSFDRDGDVLTRSEVIYASCVSMTGEHVISAETPLQRAIGCGWIFFIFMMTAVYTAALTAYISNEAAASVPYANIFECIEDSGNCLFCLQNGSANAGFFSTDDAYNPGLQTKMVSSVPDQIDAVLDNTCGAAEVTLEDAYTWALSVSAAERCDLNVGYSIVRRERGMMTMRKNACLTIAISALYHAIKVGSIVVYGKQMAYDDLINRWFKEVLAPPTEGEDVDGTLTETTIGTDPFASCLDPPATALEKIDNMFHTDKSARSGALGIPEFLGVLSIMMLFVFGTLIAHCIRHPRRVCSHILIYAKICCGSYGNDGRVKKQKTMMEEGRAGDKGKKKKKKKQAGTRNVNGSNGTEAAGFGSRPKLKMSAQISSDQLHSEVTDGRVVNNSKNHFERKTLNGKSGRLTATAEEISLHDVFPELSRVVITMALADSGGDMAEAASLLTSNEWLRERQASGDAGVWYGNTEAADTTNV